MILIVNIAYTVFGTLLSSGIMIDGTSLDKSLIKIDISLNSICLLKII
jgi:hypothetical protein